VPEWIRLNKQLIDNLELLDKVRFFCEQASLSLALAKTGISFVTIGNEWNYPAHKNDISIDSSFGQTDPVIIHYHSCINKHGYLLDSPYPLVNLRIAQFNDRLKQERRRNYDNNLFGNTDKS